MLQRYLEKFHGNNNSLGSNLLGIVAQFDLRASDVSGRYEKLWCYRRPEVFIPVLQREAPDYANAVAFARLFLHLAPVLRTGTSLSRALRCRFRCSGDVADHEEPAIFLADDFSNCFAAATEISAALLY